MTQENVTRLNYEGKEIILIATAHVSKESAALVKEVIDAEQPDSVCVELDEARYQNMQNPKAWQNADLIKVIKEKKVGYLAANLFLGSYQKRLAKKLDTPLGGEMKQGIESAQEIGAHLVLADRNIQTTFLRIWRNLNFWERSKLITGLFVTADEDTDISDKDLQDLLQEDMLEQAIVGMREEFPKVGKTLISERDQFLAYKIKNAPGKKIVAVLGGAHVPGVKEEIYKTQDIESINVVPPKSPVGKVVGWVISIALIALLAYAFIGGFENGFSQLSRWVLLTGTLAALFTALSFGHPLSILTSFVAAPFTTLNPVLACGWFTGLVEATVRKPTVKDVENITEDIFSIKGIYKNRLLRALLVVIMTNIGASLGTFIAGADVIRNLFS